MAKMKETLSTYEGALRFLQGAERRTIGHNTSVVTSWGPPHSCGRKAVGILYHSTVVLWFHPDGKIVLNSGGWQTVTTKQRMNAFLPDGVCIYQNDHAWYVNDCRHVEGYVFDDLTRHEYHDEYVIEPEGVKIDD